MTDLKDATSFHVRELSNQAIQDKIDEALDKFDGTSAEPLERPIKKGTVCASLFSSDNQWYRVEYLRAVSKTESEVRFIDFGNVQVVKTDSNLRKLPSSLLAYEPQAILSKFAYIRCPKLNGTLGSQAGKYVKKNGLNLEHDAVVVGQEGPFLSLILMEEDEEDWGNSMNAYLVSDGLALCETSVTQAADQNSTTIPEAVKEWVDFEDGAREDQIGLWKLNENPMALLDGDESDDADY